MNLKYIYSLEKEFTKIIGNGLKEFNVSVTGEKERGGEHYYLLKDGELLGSIEAFYFWDILLVENIDYSNEDVLRILLDLIYNKFKDKVGCIVHSTSSDKRLIDFNKFDFNTYGEIPNKPEGRNIYELVNFNYVPYNLNHDFEIFTEGTLPEIIKKSINKKNIDESEVIQYIVKDNDNIVGGIYGFLKDDYAEIDMLWIHKDYRNKKLATNLMSKFEQKSIEKGISQFILGTGEFQARNFYEKLGYSINSELKNCPKGYSNYSMIKYL